MLSLLKTFFNRSFLALFCTQYLGAFNDNFFRTAMATFITYKVTSMSAGSKSVDELKEIVRMSKVPFIVKGVMTVKGALKAKEAGAAAIVVSNHGGRVLDQCPATAEVLEEIVEAVGDSMKIFVDGGIRSGTDVFKALALGADGVLICRPFVPAVYGGGAEGVAAYIEKIAGELKDTMAMCGAFSLNEITRDMVR